MKLRLNTWAKLRARGRRQALIREIQHSFPAASLPVQVSFSTGDSHLPPKVTATRTYSLVTCGLPSPQHCCYVDCAHFCVTSYALFHGVAPYWYLGSAQCMKRHDLAQHMHGVCKMQPAS